MTIRLRKGYILIEWPWLLRTMGRMSTGRSTVKGAAFFPCIFVASEEDVPEWIITHERIHFRQQIETLFVGVFVLNELEHLYARFRLKKSKMQRYLYAASEQEAYLNMHDEGYLAGRPFGALWRYVRHKQDFVLVGPGEVNFVKS